MTAEQKEKHRLRMKKWRDENREHVRAHDRFYWKTVKSERNRKKRKVGKKCRLCEIKLDSVYGGYRTKRYCRDCIDRGIAKKHYCGLAQKRYVTRWGWRGKPKATSTEGIIKADIPMSVF